MRTQQNLSQHQVALECIKAGAPTSFDRSMISRFENGGVKINIATLQILAKALGCTPIELLLTEKNSLSVAQLRDVLEFIDTKKQGLSEIEANQLITKLVSNALSGKNKFDQQKTLLAECLEC